MYHGEFVLWGFGSIGNIHLFKSTRESNSYAYALRPMITISKDIIWFGGDGSEEHQYKLTK